MTCILARGFSWPPLKTLIVLVASKSIPRKERSMISITLTVMVTTDALCSEQLAPTEEPVYGHLYRFITYTIIYLDVTTMFRN